MVTVRDIYNKVLTSIPVNGAPRIGNTIIINGLPYIVVSRMFTKRVLTDILVKYKMRV